MAERKFPPWLKVRYSQSGSFNNTVSIINDNNLHTVCQSALCPNRGECFAEGTATFLILGNVCTRSCLFCAISKGRVEAIDCEEPERVAKAISEMKLDFAVITSVTRDDLPDGGAFIFVETIRMIRKYSPGTGIEVLTPDFKGDEDALKAVASANPDVFNHNIETVPRLYPVVRPEADYGRSLKVLKKMRELMPQAGIKSGLMAGIGEERDEVYKVLEDLRSAGCNLLTIGQYLSPSQKHLPVKEFVTPEQFKEYGAYATSLGFEAVASAPLVRSSYHAKKMVQK